MTELRVPGMGDAVTEVQLAEWSMADGSVVAEGQVLYVVESDKSSLEIESPGAGTLRILIPAGATVAVGQLIGQLL